MKFGKYLNSISQQDTHTNQYAAGTVSSQSFSDRKQVEKNRKSILAYRYSAIGRSTPPRSDSIRVPARKSNLESSLRLLRQKGDALPKSTPNSTSTTLESPTKLVERRTFSEPPSRGYNPYA